MLRFLLSISLIAAGNALQVFAQDGVVHLTLSDGSETSGYPLSLSGDTLFIQPDIEACEDGFETRADTLAAWQGVRAFPVSDIAECELERTSWWWLLGFPGVLAVWAQIYEWTRDDGPAGMVNLNALTPLVGGTVIGGFLALGLHSSLGADIDVEWKNERTVWKLQEYLLFPEGPPEGMSTHPLLSVSSSTTTIP